MRLPDPQRSYAVLIGTSAYRSTKLPGLPAVRNNLHDLAAALTTPTLGAIPLGHCVAVSDPADARTVYRTLRQVATTAEDTLIVYFAGHGQTGPRNELYLSLAETDPDELRVSALAYDLIRDVLADSPATNRVVILDCCFSGRAIPDMASVDDTILGQIAIEGTYILAATPPNAVALAPHGARHTAFTGELLNLLRDGVPGGPELLTFSTIYRRLLHAATTRGLPIPRQRGTGTVDQLALTRNPAAAADTSRDTYRPHPSTLSTMAQVPAATTSDRQGAKVPSVTSNRPSTVAKIVQVVRWVALVAGTVSTLSQIAGLFYWGFIIERRHGFITLPIESHTQIWSWTTLQAVSIAVTDGFIGVAVWQLGRAKNARAWSGLGLLVGYTLLDGTAIPRERDFGWVADSPFTHYIVGSGRTLLPPIVLTARTLLLVASVLAIVVLMQIRPRPRLDRPKKLVPATAVTICALAAAALLVQVTNSGNASSLFLQSCTVILALLLPILGITIRPTSLAKGLIASWLVVVLSTQIGTLFAWSQLSGKYLLYLGINLALLVSSIMYFRNYTETQSPGALS